jgi:hypothetical protein
MAHGYWKVHASKPSFPFQKFAGCVRAVVPPQGDFRLRSLHPSLTEILVQGLGLSVEGNTSSLLRSPLFQEWCSVDPNERAFGSLGSFGETNLSGKNTLLVFSSEIDHSSVERILALVRLPQPTRFLIVCPESRSFRERYFIKIASIESHFPFFEGYPCGGIYSRGPTSITLALNRQSMLIDPINWNDLKGELLEWGKRMRLTLTIPTYTDQLFGERTHLTHTARTRRTSPPTLFTPIYQFFDPESSIQQDLNHLIASGVPVEEASVINKVNKHPRNLSLIGILPNQLRTLIKRSGEEVDLVFEDVSKVLFWEGYKIWKTRKVRNREFWQQISPAEWRKQYKKPKRGKKKLADIDAAEKCTNPFHYLKKHSDLTRSRPTPCYCSKIHSSHKNAASQIPDIRKFFRHKNAASQIPDIRNFLQNTRPVHSSFERIKLYTSRDELIRGAHDRAKNYIRTSNTQP